MNNNIIETVYTHFEIELLSSLRLSTEPTPGGSAVDWPTGGAVLYPRVCASDSELERVRFKTQHDDSYSGPVIEAVFSINRQVSNTTLFFLLIYIFLTLIRRPRIS